MTTYTMLEEVNIRLAAHALFGFVAERFLLESRQEEGVIVCQSNLNI